jgi:hypothetical protein
MDSGKPRIPAVMTADNPAEIRTKCLQPYLKTNLFGNVDWNLQTNNQLVSVSSHEHATETEYYFSLQLRLPTPHLRYIPMQAFVYNLRPSYLKAGFQSSVYTVSWCLLPMILKSEHVLHSSVFTHALATILQIFNYKT